MGLSEFGSQNDFSLFFELQTEGVVLNELYIFSFSFARWPFMPSHLSIPFYRQWRALCPSCPLDTIHASSIRLCEKNTSQKKFHKEPKRFLSSLLPKSFIINTNHFHFFHFFKKKLNGQYRDNNELHCYLSNKSIWFWNNAGEE